MCGGYQLPLLVRMIDSDGYELLDDIILQGKWGSLRGCARSITAFEDGLNA
jgi:hypothetical protein